MAETPTITAVLPRILHGATIAARPTETPGLVAVEIKDRAGRVIVGALVDQEERASFIGAFEAAADEADRLGHLSRAGRKWG
jgi:hypothetical protein